MHNFCRGAAPLLSALFALSLLAGCERRQPTPDVTTATPPATTTPSPAPEPPASPAWPASPASQ